MSAFAKKSELLIKTRVFGLHYNPKNLNRVSVENIVRNRNRTLESENANLGCILRVSGSGSPQEIFCDFRGIDRNRTVAVAVTVAVAFLDRNSESGNFPWRHLEPQIRQVGRNQHVVVAVAFVTEIR